MSRIRTPRHFIYNEYDIMKEIQEPDKSQFTEGTVMRKNPDPNVIHPITGYDNEIYVKPTITNPNIIVGDFTYIADSDDFIEDIHDPCLRFQR